MDADWTAETTEPPTEEQLPDDWEEWVDEQLERAILCGGDGQLTRRDKRELYRFFRHVLDEHEEAEQ